MSPPETRSSVDRCAARAEQVELVVDREGHALENGPGQGSPAVAQRQPGERPAKIGVGPLAVAEDRQGDHPAGARRDADRPRRRAGRSPRPTGRPDRPP